MAIGFGGMLGNILGGDPGATLARRLSLTDPNAAQGQQTTASGATGPFPGAQTGAGGTSPVPGSMTPGDPGSSLPPSQSYAPDPVNARNVAALTQPPEGMSTGELLLKTQRQEDAAAGLNRNIAGIAAGFGTAQQQQSKQANLGGMPGGQQVAPMYENIMKLQEEKTAQDEHNRYMGHALSLGSLIGATPEQTQALADAGQLPAIVAHRITDMGPSDQQKNIEAYSRDFARSQGWDPANLTAPQQQQINDAKTNAWFNVMGPQDPLSKAWRGAVTSWRVAHPNQTPPPEMADPLTWDAHVKATETANVTESRAKVQDLTEARDSLPKVTAQIQIGTDIITRLKSNPKLDAALAFMNTPILNKTADEASQSGMIDPQTYQAIQDIKQLGGQVYGQGFTAGGSKRTQAEVSALVSGLSQTQSIGYSAKDYIDKALTPLENQMNQTKATALGAAQELDQVPPELHSLVPKQYLPGGSLYDGKGGDWARPVAVTTAEDFNNVPYGQAYKPTSGKYAGQTLWKGLEGK